MDNSTTPSPFIKAIVIRIVLLAVLIVIIHFIGTLPPQSLVAYALTILSLMIAGVIALNFSTTRDRSISQLRNAVAREERLLAEAVDSYRPAAIAHVDNIAAPMDGIFEPIPGVVQVETRIAVEKAAHRVIHLRDAHYVPRHIVALELRQSLGREPTAREFEMNCLQVRLQVERVQLELVAILRCLIRHHGLTRVFAEGMLVEDRDGWREWITAMSGKELSQGDDMRPSEAVNTDGPGLAEMGAALHLAIKGELVDLCPLEDFTLLDANPVSPTGELRHDSAKIEARHDAQLKCMMKEKGVAVVILGGAHDLSESIQRIAGGQCEYIRVTSKRFRETCPPELK